MHSLELLLRCLFLTTLFAALSGNVISRNKRDVNQCEGIETVQYFPVTNRQPFNCDKFIQCEHGQEIVRSCNGGKHWSVSKNACVNPEEGDCIPDVKAVQEICDFSEEVGLDAVGYDYPFDCMHFVKCSNGIASVFYCGKGLYWNAYKNKCDHICVREEQLAPKDRC